MASPILPNERSTRSIKEFEFLQENTAKDGKLGKGAFASVRLVKEKKTGDTFALKTVTINLSEASKSDLHNLKTEITVHRELRHPNIIRFFDYIQEDSNVSFILEYAPNGNLYSYMHKRRVIPSDQIFRFFYQTCLAIQHLHQNDILHRDIKPENLLLDKDFNIKLCDFGWAARSITDKRTTFCGTYEYMAPEIVRKQTYDYRVDIWSLGVLLFELIHGQAPYKGRSLEEITDSFAKTTPQFNSSIQPEIKDLIQKILRTNPSDRLSIQDILSHPYVRQNIPQQNIPKPLHSHSLSSMPKALESNNFQVSDKENSTAKLWLPQRAHDSLLKPANQNESLLLRTVNNPSLLTRAKSMEENPLMAVPTVQRMMSETQSILDSNRPNLQITNERSISDKPRLHPNTTLSRAFTDRHAEPLNKENSTQIGFNQGMISNNSRNIIPTTLHPLSLNSTLVNNGISTTSNWQKSQKSDREVNVQAGSTRANYYQTESILKDASSNPRFNVSSSSAILRSKSLLPNSSPFEDLTSKYNYQRSETQTGFYVGTSTGSSLLPHKVNSNENFKFAEFSSRSKPYEGPNVSYLKPSGLVVNKSASEKVENLTKTPLYSNSLNNIEAPKNYTPYTSQALSHYGHNAFGTQYNQPSYKSYNNATTLSPIAWAGKQLDKTEYKSSSLLDLDSNDNKPQYSKRLLQRMNAKQAIGL